MKSIYDRTRVFEFQGKKYERLFNHPEAMKYRVILSDDDYDYVECESLIRLLDDAYIEFLERRTYDKGGGA